MAISQRYAGKLDLLAQLLLYFPRVYIPDPLTEWAEIGPALHVDHLEAMLNEHRRLDDLASHGVVGFFSPMERVAHEHHIAAHELAGDASFARTVLGRLPVRDDEWERALHDGDDLDDQEYSIWLLNRPDIKEHEEQVVSAAMNVLPELLGAARAGIPLLPQRPLEHKLTVGLTKVVADRVAGATVTQLMRCPVPYLDVVPGDVPNAVAGWPVAER